MPWLTASVAATSSCVESGLLAHRAISAPPAASAIMRFAVSVVTCKHAPTCKPLSGCVRAKRSPMARNTGMLCAAQATRRLPSAARPRSLMSKACALVGDSVANAVLPGKAVVKRHIIVLVQMSPGRVHLHPETFGQRAALRCERTKRTPIPAAPSRAGLLVLTSEDIADARRAVAARFH